MASTEKSRKAKLLDTFKAVQADPDFQTYYSWGADTDRILSNYPGLSAPEAIVVGAFLERNYTPNKFEETLEHLGIGKE